MRLFYLVLGLAMSLPIWAKDKPIQILENTSSFSMPFIENIARASVALGVKEPLLIHEESAKVVIRGQNTVLCYISILSDSKISGISCHR